MKKTTKTVTRKWYSKRTGQWVTRTYEYKTVTATGSSQLKILKKDGSFTKKGIKWYEKLSPQEQRDFSDWTATRVKSDKSLKLSTYEAHKRYFESSSETRHNQLMFDNAGVLVSEMQEYIKNVTGKDVSEEQLLTDRWSDNGIEYFGYRFMLTWKYDGGSLIEHERV